MSEQPSGGTPYSITMRRRERWMPYIVVIGIIISSLTTYRPTVDALSVHTKILKIPQLNSSNAFSR
jgi:hypothetical protein